MATNFRKTKLERFVKRLESRVPVSTKEKAETLKEVIAEIKYEFGLNEVGK